MNRTPPPGDPHWTRAIEGYLALLRAPLPTDPRRSVSRRVYRWALLTGFLAGLVTGLSGILLAMSVEPPVAPEPTNEDNSPLSQEELRRSPPAVEAGDLPPAPERLVAPPEPIPPGPDRAVAPAATDPDQDLPALVPVEGAPWEGVRGLLQFRGNPSHTYYGEGPVPQHPRVLWRYPDKPMCAVSVTRRGPSPWCGSGWTGQPVVWERPDGVTEVIVGAYDRAVHFIDAATGRPTRPPYPTGDIIKGTVTLDPDGFPLLYFGSRDNKFRILALDREVPTLLWMMDAYDVRGVFNDDWDGNPSIVDDILYEGGENSYLFAIELHRDYNDLGLATVAPEYLLRLPGWTVEEMRAVGDNEVNIESSVALFKERLYYTDSGGRVVGLDLSRVREGLAPVVFDFWTGDDTDASPVVDGDGMLYVAVELERFLPRAEQLGQLIKLNPYRPEDPVVWSVRTPKAPSDSKGGIWATPALGRDAVYVPTHSGELVGVDRRTGEVLFLDRVGWHAWSSPVIVDDVLITATCAGELRAYRLAESLAPERLWSVTIRSEACIESTPAVWKGRIFVGARDGFIYAFGD